MADYHYIYQERILPIIEHFFSSEETFEHSLKESKNQYEIIITHKADTKKEKNRGILHIFFSSSKTSFRIQGKPDFKDVCERCINRIIDDAEIKNVTTHNKCFTYRDIDTDTFNAILDLIREIPSTTFRPLSGAATIVSRHSISGPYDMHVTLTYYQTSTMCLQGVISSLLIYLVTEINSLLKADKLTNENSFKLILEGEQSEIISSDLTTHFVNLQKLNSTPYPNMIKSSIQLSNSTTELGDYSCLLFGVLRAIEGILGLRMNQERNCLVGKDDKLGNYFCLDNKTSKFKFNKNYKDFDSKANLKASCQDAYTFYNIYRHPYFHTDIPNPLLTYIIIDKSEALTLVERALECIANILKFWDE